MTPLYLAEAGGGSIIRLDFDPDPVDRELARLDVTIPPIVARIGETEPNFERRRSAATHRLLARLDALLADPGYGRAPRDEQRRMIEGAVTAVLEGERGSGGP